MCNIAKGEKLYLKFFFKKFDCCGFFQYFYQVLLSFINPDHDILCITDCIYFCKRVQAVYSVSLADIYFFGLMINKFSKALGQVLFLRLNMRHKKMLNS